ESAFPGTGACHGRRRHGIAVARDAEKASRQAAVGNQDQGCSVRCPQRIFSPPKLCAEDSARYSTSTLPHHEWRRISVSHRMSRHETRDGGGKRCVHDSDRGAGSYDVVQLYDVARTHPDASIACGRSDAPFLGRTVDINISRERVGVLRLQSTQPEDARHDWVATW